MNTGNSTDPKMFRVADTRPGQTNANLGCNQPAAGRGGVVPNMMGAATQSVFQNQAQNPPLQHNSGFPAVRRVNVYPPGSSFPIPVPQAQPSPPTTRNVTNQTGSQAEKPMFNVRQHR